MPDVFDGVADWLVRAALVDTGPETLLAELSRRLRDGGVPVARLSLGRVVMHPVIGLLDVAWDADAGRADWTVLPRRVLSSAAYDEGPFGEAARRSETFIERFRHLRGIERTELLTEIMQFYDDLTDPETRNRHSLYRRLAGEGVTGYLLATVPFGEQTVMAGSGERFTTGATVSFCTRRRTGFSARERDGLHRILLPLMAAIRVTTERFFVTELVEAYLGRISGRSVLNGQIGRGDVRQIDCALLYSDMRDSTALSQQLTPTDYVTTLNRYFDCVAGAVLDHGGEVLKFIGDGIMAIFPFDGDRRLPQDMCAAALSAARDAFYRMGELEDGDRVAFGIALHKGAVIYGNIGTEKRLDFTATGKAVNVASRCEALTRALDAPLIATADFAALVDEAGQPLGRHDLRGVEGAVDLVAYGR